LALNSAVNRLRVLMVDHPLRHQIHLNRLSQKPGPPQALLNDGMRLKDDPDSARVAASLIFAKSLVVARPYADCHWVARLLLKNVKLIPSAGRPASLIPGVMAYTVKFTMAYDWERLFGPTHSVAEKLAILAKQRFETDVDAFVVSLDSLCDLITQRVYEHRGHVMPFNQYGNVLTRGAPPWLRSDFPSLLIGFDRLHQMRIHSFTAHPSQRTGAPNSRITHHQYYRLRKVLLPAFEELARVLPL